VSKLTRLRELRREYKEKPLLLCIRQYELESENAKLKEQLTAKDAEIERRNEVIAQLKLYAKVNHNRPNDYLEIICCFEKELN
jgi:hypothetical protein